MDIKISPSMLASDYANLESELKKCETGGADLIHLDVMDGHFVPNISIGAPVIGAMKRVCNIPFDVHLMIENPDAYLEDFVTPQTEYITVHQEACTHLNRTVQHIKSLGIKAGVSINPATSPSVLDYILEDVDMVLLMSVNPGFGGQKFIPSVLEKARKLRDIKIDRGLDFEIEIDGGATLDNVREIIDAGVEIVVAGSAVFKAPDIAARTAEFKEIVK